MKKTLDHCLLLSSGKALEWFNHLVFGILLLLAAIAFLIIMCNCVLPFSDSHRNRIRKIGSLCCRSNKATESLQPTKWMSSILNWTVLEETVDYQCCSLFWGAVGKKIVFKICADWIGENILMVQESSEFLINKHIWVFLFSENLSLHVEGPIWQINFNALSVNMGPLDLGNRNIQKSVSNRWERE